MSFEQTPVSVVTHETLGVQASQQAPLSNEIHRVKLGDFLRGQKGKFVGLDFIKENGSVRPLNGRLGVVRHLKGGRGTHGGTTKPHLVVYDVKTPGYRAVNLATVSQVRANSKCWTVIG